MGDLGLNNVHEEEVRKFLKFARYNRTQQLRSVEGSFQDLKDSRLHEDTFTVDEVEEMLDGLQAIVRGSVELELLNASHTNVLLLVQLFTQAEKWHLKLQSDISELENQKLLKEIAEFEEEEFSGVKRKGLIIINTEEVRTFERGWINGALANGFAVKLPQLKSIKSMCHQNIKKLRNIMALCSLSEREILTDFIQVQLQEINRLIEENESLKRKVSTLEKSTNLTLEEKSKLKSDLESAQRNAAAKKSSPSPGNDDELNILSNKISNLSANLREAESQYQQQCSSLEDELANTKHYVLALQHELEVVNEEFDRKFSETTQFKNLKKMLEGKNGQLKELRNRLKRYEPDSEL